MQVCVCVCDDVCACMLARCVTECVNVRASVCVCVSVKSALFSRWVQRTQKLGPTSVENAELSQVLSASGAGSMS